MSTGVKFLLDKLSDADLTINNDCSLNWQKIDEYMSNINHKYKSFVRSIIDNTIHVSFEEYRRNLLESIQYLKTIEFNLLFDIGSKIGSEHWSSALVWKEIKNNCIDVILDYRDVTNNKPIVIIDDCIYSGKYIDILLDMYIISHDEYEYRCKFMNEIIVITPYANSKSVCKIINRYNVYPYSVKIIYKIDIFNETLYNKEIYDILRLSKTCCPIYFDHKVADTGFSTFSEIYLKGLNPENNNYGCILISTPNRDHIKTLENLIKLNIDPKYWPVNLTN